MAIRKPLVMNAGRIQQLQAGDSISDPDTFAFVNDEAGSVVCGMPIYADAAGGAKKGIATGVATAKLIGLVASVTVATTASGQAQAEGIMSLTTAQWDAVTGLSGGLTFNTTYYLDTTAGKITATAPSTPGQTVVEIGTALSTTDLDIRLTSPILL